MPRTRENAAKPEENRFLFHVDVVTSALLLWCEGGQAGSLWGGHCHTSVQAKAHGGVAPKINQHFGGWVKPLEIPLESTQRSQQLGRVWFHGKDGSAAGAMTAGWFQFVSPAKAPKPSWGR